MTTQVTARPRTAEASRYYPVKVTSTVVHFIWVQADSQAGAAERASYDTPEWISTEDVADGWMSAEAPDTYDYDPSERPLGPNAVCGKCGVVESEPSHLKWSQHAGDCPDHWHHPAIRPIKADEGFEYAGYVAECSCCQSGFERITGYPRACELPDAVVLYRTKDDAAIPLREHVAGRHHSKNVPLGIHGSPDPT